jgi:hypothetical protein
LDDGAGDLDVGVAPWADGWIFAEVFVADVVAADEGGAAVGDDDFAVIAEVELEAVGVAFAGVEGTDVDAGVAEGTEIGGGETVAADFVEEDVAADAGAGAFGEGGGEATEARAAAVWAVAEWVGEAVARAVKEAEEREAAAMEAARSVGEASRRVRQ